MNHPLCYNVRVVTDWVKKRWKLALAISLVVILLTAWITASRGHWLSAFILRYFDNWSVALSAAATVILAVAAFESIMENRRIRQKDRERESKLRSIDEDRLSLQQICNWAQDAIKALTLAGATGNLAVLKMQDELPTVAAKNISIMNDVRSLPDSKQTLELIKKVDKAAYDLKEFLAFMDLKKQSLTLEKEYAPKRDELKKCFESVIEVASNLKVASKKDFPTE